MDLDINAKEFDTDSDLYDGNVKESIETPKEPETFKVVRDDTGACVSIHLLDPILVGTMKIYLPRSGLYEVIPKLSPHELFLVLPDLQKAIGRDSGQKTETTKAQKPVGTVCKGNTYYDDYDDEDEVPYYQPDNSRLGPLVDWIEKEYESKISQIKNMTDNNVITYNNLFYLFPKGQHIRAVWYERTVGAKVIKTSYNRDLLGREYMMIDAELIDSDGVTFARGSKSFIINDWEGVCKLEELPVVPLPMESPIRDELVERGRKFVKYAIGPHYLHYTGNMFRITWCGAVYFKSEGRVMVDAVSFSRNNPSYLMEIAKNPIQKTNNDVMVKEEELFMCAPSFYGFSFVAKKWGQIYVDFIDEIKFDDDAFDQLVMDPVKKDLISSLVTSKHKGMDLISGKGGGCVFLLHGPPGVGKTLTAEAISEYLHRPLYSVSVGELGTTVIELEAKLSGILEVAGVWNAVVLIDEVDIFLERRSDNDIQRNGLVSIFLRLLEYHQGILFLTTNRVKCFDAAFKSRISIALKYNELDVDARKQIWRTFLDRVEGKGKTQVDIEKLKERYLNGREIKTAIRLAKALTTKNNPDALITTQQLETILDISKSFSDEISDNL